MKFSINQIKSNIASGAFAFDQELDVSELAHSSDNDIREIDTVQVKGICTMDQEEFIFSFSIIGEMILPCARTLVDVEYPFQFETTEIFSQVEKVDQDDEIHVIEEDVIDLRPYVYEAILLKMPYRVFSKEKMKSEGEGWSFYTEDRYAESQSKKIDPRLQKLQQLLDKDEQN